MSGQSTRAQRSAGGMVGAMAVLIALVLAWVGFRALTSSEPASPTKAVDYARDVPAAREVADFDLVAPPTLPAGWRATTVSFIDGTDQHWHLGVLTDHDRYVGLEQGSDSVRSMVEQYVDPAADPGGPVDVEGREWSTYSDSGGDLALVRRQGGTSTLVVGHEVARSDLTTYVASLR